MKTSELFLHIETVVESLSGWSSPEKVCEFAAFILAFRPKVTVEAGVWCGRGTLGMALAHRHVGTGKVYAVDPWRAADSEKGQDGDNAKWWAEQDKHDFAYKQFTDSMKELELTDWVDVQRCTTDQATIPAGISLLVIDGNHGPQAVRDVERWSPHVVVGGIVYLDDLNWQGGAVAAAGARLMTLGFTPLYQRENGMFYKKVKHLTPPTRTKK